MVDKTANQASGQHPIDLTTLHDRHMALLKRHRENETDVRLVVDVKAFLDEVKDAGVWLESDAERFGAQDYLNYWSNVLYRVEGSVEDLELAEYSEQDAPVLKETHECPYNDASVFMAAEFRKTGAHHRLLSDCLDTLKKERLLIVFGATGSGRSAFVRQVLLPVLSSGAEIPESKDWRYCDPMSPGSEPLERLVETVFGKHLNASAKQEAVQKLLADPGELTKMLKGRSSVLFIDDFNELFTECVNEEHKQAFADSLYGLIRESSQGDMVILVVKQQYLSWIGKLGAFAELAGDAKVAMTFNAHELRRAILGPAESIGLKFDDDLVDRLVLEIQSEPGAIALLQFTMRRLWDRMERNRITWDDYREVGAGSVALERVADRFYDSIRGDEEKLKVARHLASRLVRPSGTRDFITPHVSRRELIKGQDDKEVVDNVLGKLIAAGLVRKCEASDEEEESFSLAHPALVLHWPLLIDWLEDERSERRQRLKLTAAAEQWDEGDSARRREALWRGSLLKEAWEYSDLSNQERAFLLASQAEADAKLHRLYMIIGVMMTMLLFALYQYRVAINQTAVANKNALQALRAEELVKEQAALSQARADLRSGLQTAADGDLLGSITWLHQSWVEDLAAAGFREDAERIAEEGGLDSQLDRQFDVDTNHIHRIRIGSVLDQSPRLALSLFQPENRPVTFVDVTGDGHYAVAVNRYTSTVSTPEGSKAVIQGSAELWELESGKLLIELVESDEVVNHASFSRDASKIITACDDNKARIWDVNHQAYLTSLPHSTAVSKATFSNDGKKVLLVGGDPSFSATVWDVQNLNDSPKLEDALFELTNHKAQITHAEFDASGDLVVTCSEDKTARIWNVSQGDESNRLLKTIFHPEAVNWASFSPDSKLVVTACLDRRARLWSTAAEDDQAKKSWSHGGEIHTAVFSPDGRYVVTAGEDATAQVWRVPGSDPKSAIQICELKHGSRIFSALFSPDSQQVVTASRDRTARVWDARTGDPVSPPLRHRGAVTHAVFGPSGARVLTCSGRIAIGDDKQQIADGGQVRVWLLNKRTQTYPTFTSWQPVSAASLAWQVPRSTAILPSQSRVPSNQQQRINCLAVASQSRTAGYVQIWDLDRGTKLTHGIRHDLPVRSVGFNPAGEKFVTASDDGEARIWNTFSGEQIEFPNDARVIHVDSRYAANVALTWAGYSPGGKYILTTGNDHKARLWDAFSGAPIGEPLEHDDVVTHAAFSPDQKHFATASADDTARIWRMTDGQGTPKLVEEISFHTADVTSVCFSPGEGSLLVTASVDQTARVWNLEGKAVTPAILHDRALTSSIFSPDGGLVVTTAQDKSVRIWNINEDLARINAGSSYSETSTPTLVTPPMRHSGDVLVTAFDTDPSVSALQTVSAGRVIQSTRQRLSDEFLSIPTDARLTQVSDVLTGHVSYPPGSPTPVDIASLRSDWEKLSATPRFDSVFGQDQEILSRSIDAWHLQQSQEYEILGRNASVIWHLNRLIDGKSQTNIQLLQRRARAYANLAKSAGYSKSLQDSALNDYDAAIKIDSDHRHFLLLERGDLYRDFARRTQRWQQTLQEKNKSLPLEDLKRIDDLRQKAIDDYTAVVNHEAGFQQIRPGSWLAWHRRARIRAENADFSDTSTWELVRSDVEEATRRGSNIEYTWHYLAIACSLLGDKEAYLETCNRMDEVFATTKSSQIANMLVWSSCLGPGAVRPARVELLSAAHDWKSVDRHYYLHTLACVAFRVAEQRSAAGQGREQEYIDAIRMVEEGVVAREEAGEDNAKNYPLDHVLLALIYHELKNEVLAAKWLKEAASSRKAIKPWAERAEVEILFREASAKIDPNGQLFSDPNNADNP